MFTHPQSDHQDVRMCLFVKLGTLQKFISTRKFCFPDYEEQLSGRTFRGLMRREELEYIVNGYLLSALLFLLILVKSIFHPELVKPAVFFTKLISRFL